MEMSEQERAAAINALARIVNDPHETAARQDRAQAALDKEYPGWERDLAAHDRPESSFAPPPRRDGKHKNGGDASVAGDITYDGRHSRP